MKTNLSTFSGQKVVQKYFISDYDFRITISVNFFNDPCSYSFDYD